MVIAYVCMALGLILGHFHWVNVESQIPTTSPFPESDPKTEATQQESWYHMVLRVLMLVRPKRIIWVGKVKTELALEPIGIWYNPVTKKYTIDHIGVNLTYSQVWAETNKIFANTRQSRNTIHKVIRVMSGNYEEYLIKRNPFLYEVSAEITTTTQKLLV